MGATAAALSILAYATHALRPLELSSVDTRFSIRGTQTAPDDLAVVAIDSRTFSRLGLQWPFPRRLHGRVIDALRKAGARAIAYDVQFTEPTTPSEDDALLRAVERADGVVLSTTEVDARGRTNVFGGDAVVRSLGARAGSTVVQPDPGGVLRRFPLSFDGLVAFAVAAAESAGAEVDRGSAGTKEPWIDYRGPPGTIPSYSFVDVLRGDVPAGAFRGKTVVVGAAAPSLKDVHVTPASGDHEMSGPEVQANAIWTVEQGFPLGSSPGWLDVLLIAALAFVAPAATLRLRVTPALLLTLGVAAGYLAIAQIAFDGGTILPVAYPVLALALATVGALVVHYLIAAFERQRVRDTFARFVPETVVEEVVERTDDDLRLGAVRREGTVLFADLRGFTAFAEALEPAQVVECLNRYLTEMSEAIMDHGGTLVAYMGDGIMAVFGAPIEQPDHADRALAATREMLFERLPRFNEWVRARGLGDGFRIGVGLNSGEVMSGQVGSKRRMEYTAIGDTTNTAARLEGMTKGSPNSVLIAESTKQLLQGGAADLAFVGELDVRGREATIRVWTLTAGRPGAGGVTTDRSAHGAARASPTRRDVGSAP
jgi:adenylate cyclase